MRIGIRREDKNQWEARVPLIPAHIRDILNHYPLEIVIQPSTIRAFSDDEYRQAGALIQEDLSQCDIIFAVKEIPINLFQPNKSYVFFSHTIKGQKYNMPALQRLVDLKATLIDYETIVDNHGRRLVFFGRYAGIAGMIDSFWALGQRLEHEKTGTPFSELKQAFAYPNLKDIQSSYRSAAARVASEGIPQSLTPLVVGFCGYGNVSRGAQEIFDIFPHIELEPEALPRFYKRGNFSNRHLYKVIFSERHFVTPKDPKQTFNLMDYYHHPEKYQSRFADFLPYLTVLINAIYWDERYPRLVTCEYLKQQQSAESLRLKVIGDITCDVNGSIECNRKITDSGNPVYTYNLHTDTIRMGVKGKAPVILAVDNLPAELPRESSAFFSTVLKDFIPALISADFSKTFKNIDLPPELKNAVILYKGKFTPRYTYMRNYLRNSEISSNPFLGD
jgi:saccharopine dehydrogenase (NAD+, L-lysine-forming)